VTDDSANKMIGEHSNVLIDRTPYRAIYPQMPAEHPDGQILTCDYGAPTLLAAAPRIPSRLSNHLEIGFSMNRGNYRDSNT
jgi:hypothetical protein